MSFFKVLDTKCILCDKMQFISVSTEDYEKYKAGMFVQDAFPYLTADQREVLISGTCGECFDKLMKPDKEVDDTKI